MSITPIDSLGWVATAVFASSYLFKKPAALRAVQAGAALLWMLYGFVLGAMPVVVSNLAVFTIAVGTWLWARRGEARASAGDRPAVLEQ
jgi:hypothetical protein